MPTRPRHPGFLLALATLTFGFVVALGQITTYDVWALLAGGRYIVRHGLPATDPFSFTAAGRPWINHSWLTQVVFYVVYDGLGRIPLIVGKSLVIALTLGLVFWLATRRAGSPTAGALATALVAVAGTPWWHVRPQIFTYLAWAASLLLLRAWRAGFRHAVWGLPIVMAFWANLHAGFMIGLVALAIYGGGAIAERRLGLDDGSDGRPRLGRLGAAALLTVLATLLTPWGLSVFQFPFGMTTSQFALETSVDWYSPNFLTPAMLPSLGVILLLVAGLALARERPSLTETVLVVGLLGSALRSGRNLPLLLIAGGPLLAGLLVSLTRPFAARRPRLADAAPGLVAIALLLGGAWQVWAARAPAANPFLQDLNERRYPVEVVQFLRTHRPPPELFNTFLWAGYELWALPEYRVFLDNRFEVYPQAVFRDYLDVTYLTPRWEDILTRWQVRTVLAATEGALAQGLRAGPRWTEVFTGREAAVFVRSGDPLTQAFLGRLHGDSGR